MSSFQVHRATARDLDGLRRLCLDASRDRNGLASARRDPLDPAEWITGRVPSVVVGEGGEPIGYAAAVPQGIPCGAPRCAEMTIYVAPAQRRRGAARAATNELLAVARTMGFWKLLAHAIPEDDAARALLERFEFREVGVLVKHVQLEGGWHDVTVHERLLMAARRSVPSPSAG